MPLPSPLFAYLGPETYLPVTSVLATVVGFFMMFRRIGVRWAKRVLFRWVGTEVPSSSVPWPHFRHRSQTREETSRIEIGAREKVEDEPVGGSLEVRTSLT